MKRVLFILVSAAIMAGIAAGCGGDAQPGTTATPTPTLASTQTPVPGETVSPTMRMERPATTEQVFQVEGLEETVETELYISPLGYSMYVDSQRYQAVHADGTDRISPSGLSVPDVSMEVKYLKDTNARATEPGYMNDYPDYTDISYLGEIEIGDNGIIARVISANTGDDAEDLVMQTYLIDEEGGVFVLTIICPRQAQEGHGSRLGQMLKTFLPFSYEK